MNSHRDLDVWQHSIKLVTQIYEISKRFPKQEMYGITNQMRRAAISIPSNIAEGAARNSKREFNHFLSIANGSLAELETQLIICKNLQFITNDELIEFESELSNIRRMILGLKRYLKNDQK